MARSRCISIGLALVIGCGYQAASAQEWSDEQMEVWEFILECNESFANKDADGVLGCFHEDFSGWRYGETVPRNKSSVEKFLPIAFEDESLAYDLRPISIVVFEDFAVAHYFLDDASRNSNGEVVRTRMQWTDVLLKEGGQWYWVGDHGGAID